MNLHCLSLSRKKPFLSLYQRYILLLLVRYLFYPFLAYACCNLAAHEKGISLGKMIVIDNPVIVELEREERDDIVVNDVIVEGFGHKKVKLIKCIRYEILWERWIMKTTEATKT